MHLILYNTTESLELINELMERVSQDYTEELYDQCVNDDYMGMTRRVKFNLLTRLNNQLSTLVHLHISDLTYRDTPLAMEEELIENENAFIKCLNSLKLRDSNKIVAIYAIDFKGSIAIVKL